MIAGSYSASLDTTADSRNSSLAATILLQSRVVAEHRKPAEYWWEVGATFDIESLIYYVFV